MLKEQIRHIVESNPEYAAITPVIEKEILHHDIIDVMVKQGAIPSFDVEKRPLLNHYNIVVPTEGLLIPVQSLQETFADKLIALAYRARRIKPRDIWDIVWIKQRGINLSLDLVDRKLAARGKLKKDFTEALQIQLEKLMQDDEVRNDFSMEMSRFIPQQIRERTIDNSEYWAYVQAEVRAVSRLLLDDEASKNLFDMSF
jgi:predicted nucleotidyltransferase component of viral defense system